jgi:hypothetical protein
LPKDQDLMHLADEETEEHQEHARPGESLSLPGSKGLLLGACVVFLALSHVTAFFLGYFLGLPKDGLFAEKTVRLEAHPSQAMIHLGPKDESFDEASQAQALLALLVEKAGKKEYVVSFRKDSDQISLICDFNNMVLTRSTTHPDGSGTTERWRDDVLERLRNAAGGRGFANAAAESRPSEISTFKRPRAPVE